MKHLLILFFIFSLIDISIAQVNEPSQSTEKIGESVYGLGFSAGVASGFGLSFRHHLPGNFSYQLVGGIIKVDNKTLYNFGGEVHFDFVRGGAARFFGAGAIGYFYQGKSDNELNGPLRAGIGIGVEWKKFEPFYFGAELLFTYFSDATILPLPQISAHYYFF